MVMLERRKGKRDEKSIASRTVTDIAKIDRQGRQSTRHEMGKPHHKS